MFTQNDKKLIEKRGSLIEEVNQQIEYFLTGFPFLAVTEAASVKNGILRIGEENISSYVKEFDDATHSDLSLIK